MRDWLSGARAIPAWVLHRLPRAGQVEYLRLWLEAVPEASGEDGTESDSERGAA